MRSFYERVIFVFSCLCTTIFVLSITFLIFFLVKRGWSALSFELIFGNTSWDQVLFFKRQVVSGIFPAIVGTLYVIFLSVSMAIPIGVSTGIYLAEFSNPRIRYVVDFFIDILACVPSIVIGLFGLCLAIFLHKYVSTKISTCLLVSSVALAVLIIPYLVRTTQLAIGSVPTSMKLSSMSIGASKMQNLWYVLLPNSMSSILSGVILSIGRAAEDTAVIMLTGAVMSAGVPESVMSKYEALPFFIYYISAQYKDQNELAMGFGAAIILLFICMILFFISHIIKNIVLISLKR